MSKTVYEIETIKVKLKVCETQQKEKILYSGLAVNVLRGIFDGLDDDQEHFVFLALSTQSQIKGFKVICSGGFDQAHIDTNIVFRNALLMGAKGIIISHNHPGGDVSPSMPDRTLTKRIKDGGKLLDIEVLDHIIIGQGTDKYCSMNEEGFLN